MILLITFKAIASPDRFSSSSQLKYVTFEYCYFWILMLLYFISNVPIFLVFFGWEKDRFSFIVPKVNAQLVIDKPVTYVTKILVSSLFIWSRSLCWYSKHVSSAYRNRSQSLVCRISFIYCGTPHLNSAVVENLSWTLTWNFLLRGYDLNRPITSLENPSEGNLCIKI